jgi:polysaccharide pyruvyl transferase WcaK-like protein
MELFIPKLLKVLDKFKEHINILCMACKEHMNENKEFLSTLDRPEIDNFMSSFLNKKLRDEGLEASPDEINYLGLCISTLILKSALENNKDNF